jgi:tetratricopeptide (TPR) repeat protein
MYLRKLSSNGKTIHIIWIISKMKLFSNYIIFSVLIVGFFFPSSYFLWAAQYQSNELLESKGQSKQTVKSILELEAELIGLSDAYSKDSTARYLARHYAQQNNEKSVNKAIEYYRLSLAGDGLSIYAQQATTLELLGLFFQHKLYQDFSEGFDHYIALKGQPTPGLNIKAMLSYYYLKQNKKTLKLAKILFKNYDDRLIKLQLSDLNQILFIFYNLGDFVTSAKVQQSIVLLDPLSVEQWLRLSKLYIKNNKADQAAEILLLMTQKGLLLEQDDLLLMADLIHNTGNAFIAARLMQQLLDEFRVDHNLDNFDRLFKYWYLAQETDKAALALKSSLKYDDSIKRYLDLAEVYYQQQDWVNMNATIKQGCFFDIAREHTGRANLLLGISELKLNNHGQAIKAFYNATMISGKVEEAIAYLNYLKADIKDMRRYERISGVCEPQAQKSGS